MSKNYLLVFDDLDPHDAFTLFQRFKIAHEAGKPLLFRYLGQLMEVLHLVSMVLLHSAGILLET